MFDSVLDLILHLSIFSGFLSERARAKLISSVMSVVAKSSACANSDLKYKKKRAVVDTHITGKRNKKNMCTCGLKIVTSFVNQYFPFRLGMKLRDKFLLMPLHTM